MELKDLTGKHILDAVDFSAEKVNTWGDQYEDASVCRFRLDGKVYMVIEDPDDAYRSSMKEIAVDKTAVMKNVFQPCEVVGRHRTVGSYGEEDDVLELIDTTTGETILEVGTENVDDYYPGFVANFRPEALSINNT